MIDENEYTDVKLPPKLYDKIEGKVVSLYRELHITEVPIDPFKIAWQKGYIVKPYSCFDPSERFLFSEKKLDGLNYFDPVLRTFVICFNDVMCYERIRFTLMHEIGHISMGHREESELARRMADYYAAYALAPSPIIELKNCADYLDVAKIFEISSPCAELCFQRFVRWRHVSQNLKPYERDLLRLFQNL